VSVAIGGDEANDERLPVRSAFKGFDGRRLDRLSVRVHQTSAEPNAFSEASREGADDAPSIVMLLARSQADAQPCVDSCGEPKRCRGAIAARSGRCFIACLIPGVGAELIKTIPKPPVVDVRDELGALALGCHTVPSICASCAHFDLSAGES
jgi:hypothetical protein